MTTWNETTRMLLDLVYFISTLGCKIKKIHKIIQKGTVNNIALNWWKTNLVSWKMHTGCNHSVNLSYLQLFQFSVGQCHCPSVVCDMTPGVTKE